mgnify:CR=1 FL=1
MASDAALPADARCDRPPPWSAGSPSPPRISGVVCARVGAAAPHGEAAGIGRPGHRRPASTGGAFLVYPASHSRGARFTRLEGCGAPVGARRSPSDHRPASYGVDPCQPASVHYPWRLGMLSTASLRRKIIRTEGDSPAAHGSDSWRRAPGRVVRARLRAGDRQGRRQDAGRRRPRPAWTNGYKVDESTNPRLPDSLQDTPQSITIVPLEVMREQAAFSLRDCPART